MREKRERWLDGYRKREKEGRKRQLTDLHCRHLTMVEHWITGKWLRSLKGWMRTPRGRRAFFNKASVSGI
jgi:hypothetical protein